MSYENVPELQRIAHGIELLSAVRHLFAEMEDHGERERAWRYLSDRFGEYEGAEMPAWEVIAMEATE